MAKGDKGKKILAATTALAPIAPEVLLPALAAEKATAKVTDVLTGDIAVVHASYPRGTKKNPLPPLESDYHVNLASIGIGAFLLALGALAIGIAWNGVQTIGGGLTGLKDSRPTIPGGSGNTNPPPGSTPPPGTNPLLCGPACIALHVFDPWNIPACVALCIARGGP